MANLTESPIWEDGVFQLEKTTPPLGGAPAFNGNNPIAGHANVPSLQLANRTSFLRDQINLRLASVSNYEGLRAYTGPSSEIKVLGNNIRGDFYYDANDSASPDNGFTVIVGSDGRRWKRHYSGAVELQWGFTPSITDHTDAWTRIINFNNSTSKGIVVVIPDFTTKVTTTLPDITKPMWLRGYGTSKSVVFFAGVDGFTMDYSGLPAGNACGRLSDLTLTTNVASRTGLKLIGQTTDNPGMKFRLDKIEVMPHGRVIGTPDSSEWAVAIQIGRNDGTKTSEVIFNDVAISGSLSNTLYSTKTNSVGVLAYSSTGFRYNLPKIALVGEAIVCVGQAEGAIITGGTIFGVNKGIVFRNLTNPANNHWIDGTHVSAYTRGIAFEQPANNEPLPLSNFISSAFILERESGTTKTEDYVGIELYAKYTEISNTVIWSNSFGGTHKRIGIRTTNHNNKIDASFKNCEYPFDILTYAADPDTGGVYADNVIISGTNYIQVDKSSSPNLIFTNLKTPTVGTAGLVNRAASWRLLQNSTEKNLGRINTGGLVLSEHISNTITIDVSSTATGTSGYDGRLLFTGGDTTNNTSGKGDIQLAAATVRTNASVLRPEASGGTSLGLSNFPFSVVYANTGTIQTSDENYKANIQLISDAVLDAGEDIDCKVFQLKSSIEEKGEKFARFHFGVIAQDIERAFSSRGLNAFDYGLLGYDEWEAQEEVWHEWEDEFDENGNLIKAAGSELITAAHPAGSKYSVRYDETLILLSAVKERCIKRMKQQLDSLKNTEDRLKALEDKLNARN